MPTISIPYKLGADADTVRRQASRSRHPRKAEFLALAEKLELESAGQIAKARHINAMEG